MIKNYLKYITHPVVRKDDLENKKIKGTPTCIKGRQIITPEQMGHDVKICGEYEYCLSCGRTTKAKHDTSAKRVFWRRQLCRPVVIMRR
eukprot:5589755-Heterocapsa_arctica.AAC.1